MPRPSYRGFRGDHLRTLREQRGWTQEQLAVRVRVFPTMIGKWERGAVAPGAANVAKLAAVLDARPQDFSAADPDALSLVELRVRSGLTRPQAARVTGISQRRLTQYEHSTCRPTSADASAIAGLYDVRVDTVFAAYDRERATAYPGLPPEDQAC
jgi:transcriptional regulator with XRE-family HTH domain